MPAMVPNGTPAACTRTRIIACRMRLGDVGAATAPAASRAAPPPPPGVPTGWASPVVSLASADLVTVLPPSGAARCTVADGVGLLASGAPRLAGTAARGEDAELTAEDLLALWRQWGAALPRQLAGSYALLIADGPSGRFLAARSHDGVEPLYCTTESWAEAVGRAAAAAGLAGSDPPAGVIAATSLAQLRAWLPLPATLDPAGVADLLLGTMPSPGTTCWQGIAALPPGSAVVITPEDGWRVQALPAPALPGLSPRETDRATPAAWTAAAAALREALTRATAPAQPPPGRRTALWLSGGVDSSAVGGLLAAGIPRTGAGTLVTCSLAFPGHSGADESRYITAFRRRYPTVHQVEVLADWDPVAHVRAMVAACGQPLPIGNSAYAWHLSGLSAAAGADRVATGHDGDTTVGDRTALLGTLLGRGRWLQALALAEGLHRRHQLPRRRLLQWACTHVAAGLGVLPGPDVRARPTLARQALLAETGAWERARRQALEDPERAADAWQEHARELRSPGRALASTYVAHCAQAHGLSLIHPLMDDRVVDLLARLPARLVLAQGWLRGVLRLAVADVLPPALAWRRRKAHLSAPLYRALQARGLPTIEGLLADAGPGLWQWCDEDRVRQLLARLRQTPWQQLGDADVGPLWGVLHLAAALA